MNKTCASCQKTFASTKNLMEHLYKKKIPCDLICRICKEKCVNVKKFNIHMTSKHEAKTNSIIQESEDLPEFHLREEVEAEMAQKPLVPLEDFRQVDIIKQIIKQAKETGAIGTQTVININFIFVNNPVRTAAEAFRVEDFQYALRCLENPENVKHIAAAIMASMHTDPKRPEMHTIKMKKDLSRKQVKIFSRPSDDLPAEWLSYGYDAALRRLSDHAAYLLKTALLGSINVFDFKFREEGQKLCVCLSTPIDHEYIIMYDEKDDDETGMAYSGQVEGILLKLELYEGELFDVTKDDRDIKEQMDKLFKHIKAKGTQVLQHLKDLKFTGKDIGAFLERTRRPLTMIENIV